MAEMTAQAPHARAAAADAALPAVIVVGPLPPPWHGGAMATAAVLRSGLQARFRVVHVDTTDPRGLENIGRMDVRNVLLALRHVASMTRALVASPGAMAYVPLAQNLLGVLRDAALVLPALLLRRRVVLHVHGSGLREFHDATNPVARALLRLLLRRATRVVVLGDSLRPMLTGITPAQRVAVLPNGVPDPFDGRAPARSRGPTLRLLCLGNVRRAKGYLDAIEAVRILRERGFDVVLDLAGGFSSDADRRECEAALAGMGEAVRLHGVVQGRRKRELFEQAHVFVLPSHGEGHPYVLLEAMAAGLPVVATALPTVAETVVDGETGLLVPVGDAPAMAVAVERLVRNEALASAAGAAARRRYEERYSEEAWSRALSRIMWEAAS